MFSGDINAGHFSSHKFNQRLCNVAEKHWIKSRVGLRILPHVNIKTVKFSAKLEGYACHSASLLNPPLLENKPCFLLI